MKKLIYTSIVSIALCGACAHKDSTQSADQAQQPTATPVEEQGPTSAQATIKSVKKQKVKGVVKFTQDGDNVKVEATVEGLKVGSHGFHIHEKGDCSAPDFSSAGGHYNPSNKPHGAPESHERHVGDMGNIVANKKGKATLNMVLTNARISGTEGILGKAVVVHEKADDLKTQPTGDAGGRIGCGVIEAAAAQ